jgi:hypothetical protein
MKFNYFPQGGNEKLAPSPLGEGWEGGKKNKKVNHTDEFNRKLLHE